MLATGCANQRYNEPDYSRGGPPPHATAHGYRHKHHHDLVFDSGLGVYIVVGRPDYYFWDKRYYRYYDGYWQFSSKIDGRWYRDDGKVPRKLYQSKGGPGKGDKGKGPGKDKGKGNQERYNPYAY